MEAPRDSGAASFAYYALAGALTSRGLLAGDDLAQLEEAVEVAARHDRRSLSGMRALIELGAARRRAGMGEDARKPLREGLDLARRGGAVALAERARSELELTGARQLDAPLTGAESLTAAERRVCEMAGEGMSNPEIAQTLYVTRRTVETHLTHSYSKLGISSRRELSDALAS